MTPAESTALNVNDFSDAAAHGIDIDEWGVPATLQTIARMTRDPILSLARGKHPISPAQVSAANEIRSVYTQIVSDVRISGSRMDGMPGTTWRSTYFFRKIAGIERYNAWCEAMTEKGWPLGPVIDVIAEGESISTVAKQRRRRKATIIAFAPSVVAFDAGVRDSLALYARLAGWR